MLLRESLECLQHESYPVEQIGVNEESELLQKFGHAMLSGNVEGSGWCHLASNTW